MSKIVDVNKMKDRIQKLEGQLAKAESEKAHQGAAFDRAAKHAADQIKELEEKVRMCGADLEAKDARIKELEAPKGVNVVEIARVCHQVNKAYCESLGDNSQLDWIAAPQWQKDSAIKGVEFCLANPDAPVSANHDSWLEVKRAEGWKYGPVKDAEKKEHPCFVPYEELPAEQKAKDYIFKAVVAAMSGDVGL